MALRGMPAGGSLAMLVVLVQLARAAAGAEPPSGLWDASVTVDGVEIPFRFELSRARGAPRGAFFNGDERVRSTGGSFRDDTLSLRFDHYGSELEAKWSEGVLSGSYRRAGRAPYAFRATPHVAPAVPAEPVPSIAGHWEIGVQSASGAAAWHFFVRQAGAEVAASILRLDGDTGLLSGAYRDGRFVLSHFSGARPALLEITPSADGTLSLLLNRKAHHTALRSAEARAKQLPEPADPSRWTSVKDPSRPLQFAGTDLDGRTVTWADPRFKGKVVLLNIMGSWCPNCHDEAAFLVELDRKYRRRGLEVVSIAFEDAAQLERPTRLRAFIDAYAIRYTVLLGGEPKQATAKLPDAVHLDVWPITFFIGRDGLVRGAHAGFAGKATGEAHERLRAELTRTVERLLADRR